MGLKKNSPGCNCCECLSCSASFQPLLGYNVTFSGITEGYARTVNGFSTSCVDLGTTIWTTTNMGSTLNATHYVPAAWSVLESGCLLTGDFNYFPSSFANISLNVGGTVGFWMAGAMQVRRNPSTSSAVSIRYSMTVGLNSVTGRPDCGDGQITSAVIVGTETINPGDTCKTWIKPRTFTLSSGNIFCCTSVFAPPRHANRGWNGWSSVSVTMEPVWTA